MGRMGNAGGANGLSRRSKVPAASGACVRQRPVPTARQERSGSPGEPRTTVTSARDGGQSDSNRRPLLRPVADVAGGKNIYGKMRVNG